MRDALNIVVAFAGEAEFARVLGAMLGRRSEIAHLMQVSGDDPAQYCEERLRWLFNLAKDDTRESVLARSASLLAEGTLREAGRHPF